MLHFHTLEVADVRPDVESEIRTMCEQSSVPKALVDIAIPDPDKLDELEEEAEG